MSWRGRLLPAGMMLGLICAAVMLAAAPASASTTGTPGDRVLNIAETRAGAPYSYGAAGPSAFDCSGLVAWAAGRAGITLPHSTYAMLAGTPHLYRIPLSEVRRGDLVFYGPGHVEIATVWYHVSFGAHDSGSRVGWIRWGIYFHPTMAMRLHLRGDPSR